MLVVLYTLDSCPPATALRKRKEISNDVAKLSRPKPGQFTVSTLSPAEKINYIGIVKGTALEATTDHNSSLRVNSDKGK